MEEVRRIAEEQELNPQGEYETNNTFRRRIIFYLRVHGLAELAQQIDCNWEDAGLDEIDRKILRARGTMAQAERQLDAIPKTPGSFVTGRSNRSRALDKRL